MNITIIALQALVEAATRDPLFRCVEEIEIGGADLLKALEAQGVETCTTDQLVLTLGQARQRLAELTTDLVEIGCANCDMLLGAAETYPTEPVYCKTCEYRP
jgi:hypothetical protein